MKKYNKLIMAAILLLAVGFAAVSTTLILNGTLKFGVNLEDFEVLFTEAVIDGVDVTDTTISEDGKSLTFVTKELAKIGDNSVLEFKVTNNSTQYDAEVTMECVADGENSEYYTIAHTMPEVIPARTNEYGTVTATLKKNTIDAISESFTCTLTVNAVERTESAHPMEDFRASDISFQSEYEGWDVSTVSEALDYLRARSTQSE